MCIWVCISFSLLTPCVLFSIFLCFTGQHLHQRLHLQQLLHQQLLHQRLRHPPLRHREYCIMIHILMIILVSFTHILGILTLFATIFFTGLRPNQPHLNHLLPNQPPRSLQLKVPQRGHQRRVENVLVMRYVTWPSAPHTMDAQGHWGKRISLPLSNMRALGVTFVRDMANHKLSRLHYVLATAGDARNTAEANHSDNRGWNCSSRRRSGWYSKHTPGGYANYEHGRNFFGTL